MRHLASLLSAALLIGLLGACGSSGQPAAAPSGTSTSTSSPGNATPGLRGIRVQSFDCPATPVAPTGNPQPIDSAEAIRLCPIGIPGGGTATVTLTAGQPAFAPLIAALSVPDQPPTGAVCPAYADALQSVLAKSGAAVFAVKVPIDGCNHYLRSALDLLTRARGA